ncbi:hypothetical protein QJS66_22425 [Kocuria rhizophila]|nr:hypothetical protein QJS66_22425 [Kocuria rhizophila]
MLHASTDPAVRTPWPGCLRGALALGARDLCRAGDWAAELERRHERAARGEEPTPSESGAPGTRGHPPTGEDARDVVMADAVDGSSLIEALETLPRDGWVSSRGRSITPEGHARRLRSLLGTSRPCGRCSATS